MFQGRFSKELAVDLFSSSELIKLFFKSEILQINEFLIHIISLDL